MQRPPWRIVRDRYQIVLTAWADAPVAGAVRLDRGEAERRLRWALGLGAWSEVHHPLAVAARYVVAGRPPRLPLRTYDARRVVFDALARGVLVAWLIESEGVALMEGGGSTSAGEDDTIASEGLLQQKTWIEVELLDMDGNPMRGEPYWVKLPDGTIREGSLDEHGRVYFDELDPGSAEIHWPNRDGDATEPSMPSGQPEPAPESGGGSATGNRVERTWVEIELLDMDGQPVPHERYWIKLPDGTVREGVLDAMGCAYFDDLDPGQCTIRWLGRDEEAAFLEPDATTPESTDRVAAQVAVLESAARDGVPFCEECERARRQQEAEA